MMDACQVVEKETDKVLSKFNSFNDHTQRTLSDLIDSVESVQNELKEGCGEMGLDGSATADLVSDCIKKVRDVTSFISSQHRELHPTVSKVGKAIDKNFVSDFASTSNDQSFDGGDNQELLNRVMCEHFVRQGMLDIADELMREAHIEADPNHKEPFTELNAIVAALREHNLEPALEWVAKHRETLQAQNSALEFKLHRLHFVGLLQKGIDAQIDAIKYARQHFQHLAEQHEKEIQVLMGSLLYLRHGVHHSPYQHLLNPQMWVEICDIFLRDACALLGLSVESPLAVCVNAGCVALPALLNIKQVMQQRQVQGMWSARDELPIEIQLGRQCQFHSVFACPILRQQSTDTNPPMRLVCGHVISRDALHKLASANKLKCPYCPAEQNPADAKFICF